MPPLVIFWYSHAKWIPACRVVLCPENIMCPLAALHPLSRASMTMMGFRMERSVAGVNEPIGLTVAARNVSSSRVNKRTTQLQQECNWRARGHRAKKDQTLASILVLPGSELEGLQWVPGTENDRGQSVVPVEENPSNDLQ